MNIFTQPTSQFQVLDSVPDVIQQVGANTDQHDTSNTADAAAVENADQATDAHSADPTALALKGLNINKELTITGMALMSTSMLAEVPHPGDPVPTPPHASASTEPDDPDLAGPSMLATTSTPHVDPVVIKTLYQKRYQHKAKMEPGVAITAR